MANRLQEIDALRSAAIIFIVFAHIDSFTYAPIFDELDTIFAFFGLSVFFFISGFLMQTNNKFTNGKDVLAFLKKRAVKIYPLYWLSLLASYAVSKIGFYVLYSNEMAADKPLLLLHILGLQGFLHETSCMSVWWFVGAIMLYYFMFSIILCCSRNTGSLLIYSFFMFLPLLFLRNEFNLIHAHIFNYYLIFIAGILSASAKSLGSLKNITLSYSALLLSFFLMPYVGINTGNLADIGKQEIIFLILAFVFTLYKIRYFPQSRFKLNMLIKKLAYGSYSVYLFHVLILSLVQSFILLLIPAGILNQQLFDSLILFFGIPFTLVSGYFVAIYFDKIN